MLIINKGEKNDFSDKTKHQLLLHNTEAGLQIYQLVSAYKYYNRK